MLDPNNETIYAGNGTDGLSESLHDNVNYAGEFVEDNNLESNLRRRKGKIISCAKETIEHASRQLRRRVPYAGHLMTPKRLWLNKIPTLCDVVIEFPEHAPDEALRWLLSRIRSQPPAGLGLQANVKAHESSKRTAFYISSPCNVLYKAAEEARLPKRLRADLGGALKEFTTRESHCFAQAKDDGSGALFTSQERQWLVLQVLQGLRAGPSDLEALQGKASVEEGQSIVSAFQACGLICQIFPLHETSALTRLQINWVRKLFAAQPLDDIAEYFGVKVALYFAWLGHYTCALGVPAIFGIIMWAGLYGRAWRRYSVELAFRWGTLSTPPELLEPPRPLYKGTLIENPVTGRLEPKESPSWQRRAFRYLVSFPVIGMCLAMVFCVMFLMLRLQDWLDHHIPDWGVWKCMCMANQDWTDSKLPEQGILSCFSVVPKVLLAGAITLMDEGYFKLAVWLNDKENYRLQSKYENHLIAKVTIFQFVNSFLSLFYIAFYLRDQDKLKEQLAGLLISRQIIGNLRESAFPYFMEQLKLAKLSFNLWGALSPTQEVAKSIPGDAQTTQVLQLEKLKEKLFRRILISPQKIPDEKKESPGTPKRSIGQAEIESSLYKYDGTFSDHLEMLVQMGYVVLFSAAFPLAGLCALANNLLEIRSDAFKLAHVHQRPFGQRVANIGTWQNALGLLGLAAVIVNCALIGLSGQVTRLWPGLTTTQTIILIVTLEHIMLGLRSALKYVLPELPSWLAAEICRAEHIRREMQCRGTTPRQTPPSPTSTASTSQPDVHSPNNIIDTNDHSLESQVADDIIFHHIAPISPKFKKFSDLGRNLQDSVDADDSPPPINIGTSMNNLPLEIPPYSSACHNCKPNVKSQFEIPPFRGSCVKNMHACSAGGSSSSSLRVSSPPMLIPEIPPFKKAQQKPIVNPSPPKIPEIPAFKQRKSKDWEPNQMAASDENQLQLPAATANPEWVRRLKGADSSVMHRSVDCIANKELTIPTPDPELLKGAPSWTNVAYNKDPVQSPSGAPTLKISGEEDDKAAELAAKKSRVKQSLIKRARSVAIFSLKLKERRAREAEKQSLAALEQAKANAPTQTGGELDMIGIEQLIQIDDVIHPSTGSGTL
ncbi:anoctamin-8 isoform X2 [Bradysia coprophila]|uniref:anoctamin-8 isoform X2 n=1 Tax=Bradysia coprophila TaxID=38358 RepID=UPI00187DCB32|nr:anoctamin-8 isoform X2 [Bradysia coprophila]